MATIKQHYCIYLNTRYTGIVYAADCVLQERNGLLIRFGFRYTPNYLSHPQAFALDPVQLPLREGEIELTCHSGIPGIIDDYLPDDWGRKLLTQLSYYRDNRKYNANSVIDTLAMLGSSQTGALSIVPVNVEPAFDLGAPIDKLEQAEQAAQAIESIDFDPVEMDEMSLLYLANNGSGIGGARPKALVHDGDQNYIAKFNRLHGDSYNNARVELACLEMAKAAGIQIESGQIQTGINGREVLLLNRFDVDGEYRRHIITVNALLKDVDSQRDIGHVFKYDLVHDLLKRYSAVIERDARQLLRLMFFNRSINNTDDHERNFSFEFYDGEYVLAPAYDLVPVLAAGSYHAAGYQHKPSPPKPEEAAQLGKVFGLSKTIVNECADDVIDVVSRWMKFAEATGVKEGEAETIQRYFTVGL